MTLEDDIMIDAEIELQIVRQHFLDLRRDAMVSRPAEAAMPTAAPDVDMISRMRAFAGLLRTGGSATGTARAAS